VGREGGVKVKPGYLLGVVVLVLMAAACGRGESIATKPAPTAATTASESPTPLALACSGGGAAIQVTARDSTFTKKCLAAPANTAFTIRFDNKDYTTVHNLAIYTEDPNHPLPNPNAQTLFKGAFVVGPKTVTYKVSSLPPGRYFFHCDTHPFTMFGTFVVS
jgi:plastocyanin